MADTREGEDGGLFRPEGKSIEKGGGSAPQIHLGRPRRGNSSSKGGVHPDALKKREEKIVPRKYHQAPPPRAPLKAPPPRAARRVAQPAPQKPGRGKLLQKPGPQKPPQKPGPQKLAPQKPVPQKSAPRVAQPLQPPRWPKSSFLSRFRLLLAPRQPKFSFRSPFFDKASEEGSATEGHCETGEGISVIKSPPGDSGLTQEGDLVRLREEGGGGGEEEEEEEEEEEDPHDKISSHSLDEVFIPPPKSLLQHPDALKKEEPSASNIDDKASEEGSATERHCETGEGISVIKSPPGDSGLTQEGDLVRLREEEGGRGRGGEEEEEDPLDKISSHSLDEVFIPPPKSLREHPDALKKEEPSTSNIEDKASEEGSATERHCETGKGISVIKSPPGDSGLTQEGDLVRLRRHKEQLIKSLRKVNSGTTDVPEILDDSLLCLMYLSIFPENSEISCRRVSRLWAAEGLLTDLRKAEVFLNDLLDRKYIYRVKERADGELSTFRLDDSVRQTIASFSDLLGILKITNEGSKNSSERVRRLSVQGGIVTDLNEEKLSQLRSLFVFNVSSNKDETTTSKASLLGNSENPLFPFNFKFLKVLDLTSPPPHTAPDELILLRYLSLRDTSIKEIPAFIGRLKHLEFLDLKHSLVTELPEEVGGLKEICHILIYHHEKDPLMESYNLIGFKALCSVGGLKRLEKLCFVESDDSILKDLQNLTKLTRLGITKLRKEHGKGLCTSLKELKKLESLNLHAFDEDEILDVHYLSSPPESLKRLYLHGRLDKLPNWISPHCHLTKIVLRWSCLKGATWQNEESHMEAAAQQEKESHLEAATQQVEDLLATLGKLPELVELELRRAYHGMQLDFKNGQFPKLKILLLDELGRLRSMSLEEGTMPCLEDLTISRCQWLERIPTGIEHIISTLQALEFFDMSREFYKMVPDDYRNSLKVHLTQWRPGQWKTTPLVLDECDECFAGEN